MKNSTLIPATIKGIPCLLEVITYKVISPWIGSIETCPSDLDYYGYTEIEYQVRDTKGYTASWLEKKIDSNIDRNLKSVISEYYNKGE